MPLALDTHALNHWIRNFVFGVDGYQDSDYQGNELIIAQWSDAKLGSALDLALQAFSQIIFGRTQRVPEAIDQASQLYYQTVIKLNADLKNPAADKIDELLVATMLMGSFEVREACNMEIGYD